jgi:hypothetical protein
VPFKAVHLPPDEGLSRLLGLRWPGFDVSYKIAAILGDMSNAADPRDNRQQVEIESAMVPVVADVLASLLEHAREVGDPAADALAGVLAREFGRT